MSKDEALAILAIAINAALFASGSHWITDELRDRACKNGVPVVIDAKVYRCVEAK